MPKPSPKRYGTLIAIRVKDEDESLLSSIETHTALNRSDILRRSLRFMFASIRKSGDWTLLFPPEAKKPKGHKEAA